MKKIVELPNCVVCSASCQSSVNRCSADLLYPHEEFIEKHIGKNNVICFFPPDRCIPKYCLKYGGKPIRVFIEVEE